MTVLPNREEGLPNISETEMSQAERSSAAKSKGALMLPGGEEAFLTKEKPSPQTHEIFEKSTAQGKTSEPHQVGEKRSRITETEKRVMDVAERCALVAEQLTKKGVPQVDAQRIAQGYRSGWEGFVSKEQGDKVPRQLHGIERLKVYRDPSTGRMVADYGLEQIVEGSSKRAKGGVRVTDEGHVEAIVRLTRKKGDIDPIEAQERFFPDIKKELALRAWLAQDARGPVSGLLKITEIPYINEEGESKTRYVSEGCEGDYLDLLVCHDADTGEELPRDPERTRKACLNFRDVVTALAELHRRGLVHRDLKIENILSTSDGARIADLGDAARLPRDGAEGDPYVVERGTFDNMAPEIFFGVATENSLSMDMFSIGGILLEITRPDLRDSLTRIQYGSMTRFKETQEAKLELQGRMAQIQQQLSGAEKLPGEGQSTLLREMVAGRKRMQRIERLQQEIVMEYREAVSDIQRSLHATGDALDSLTAELIDFDPQKRPTSAQTEERYHHYVASQSFSRRFPSMVG